MVNPGTNGVQSVARAMLLLETLAEDDAGWRLMDLVRRTGLAPSTVHRLLTTLQERRFVQCDSVQGLWSVGRQAFTVGAAFGQRRTLVAPVLPYLRQLRDLTRETANFGVVDEGEVIVMAQIESREIVRAIGRTGGRAPLLGSAMGKAVLATYAPSQVDDLLAQVPSTFHSGDKADMASRLHESLAVIRDQGYAVDDENRPGLTCIASAVVGVEGEPIGAISVSGLAARLLPARLPQIGLEVARIAAAVSAELRAVPVAPESRVHDPQRLNGGSAIRHSARSV